MLSPQQAEKQLEQFIEDYSDYSNLSEDKYIQNRSIRSHFAFYKEYWVTVENSSTRL